MASAGIQAGWVSNLGLFRLPLGWVLHQYSWSSWTPFQSRMRLLAREEMVEPFEGRIRVKASMGVLGEVEKKRKVSRRSKPVWEGFEPLGAMGVRGGG